MNKIVKKIKSFLFEGNTSNIKVGLTQLNKNTVNTIKKETKVKKELGISDLLRKTV